MRTRRSRLRHRLTRPEVAAVRARLEHVKYELIPLKSVYQQLPHLPEAATVAVTASPTQGMAATIDMSIELHNQGFDVIPHVSARMIRDRRELAAILDRLERNSISKAFVVGGDADDPGEFFDAMALITAMEEVGHGLTELGVTGYPEGHPQISDSELNEALAAKQPHSHYVTTQMCFAPTAVADWIHNRRQSGIHLPAYIGIPGVAELRKLLSISLRIGVGDSVRFISKNTSLIGKLVRPGGYAPDALVLGLGGTLADPAADVAGFHVYTFNQVETTERWRRDMLEAL